ncbi:MAG: hypothetical protein LBI87_05855 [Candidatus Accumulibacter sp.]|jgi:hypothetical protein|nr:hypothetical protein [Accumulibacter sp.]
MNDDLALLGRIGEAHRRMAEMADALDWDGIVEEWESVYPAITELRQVSLDRMTGGERDQATRQIAELVELQKRISARITPWMEQVRPLLETFRKYPLGGD